MNDTLKEALDFATTKEKEAEEFYRTWSSQASDPAVKKVFSELAETERGHAEKLSRIAPEDLIAQGAAPSDLRLSDYLVEVEPQAGMSLQDALILAMNANRLRWRSVNGSADFWATPSRCSLHWRRRSAATSVSLRQSMTRLC